MSVIPGFDPSMMTEDELLNKQSELNRRLVYFSRFSSSPEIADQIVAMIMAIEQERTERVSRTMMNMRQSMFPEIIESDPDLVVKETTEQVEEDDRIAARRKASKQRMITRVTADDRSNIPQKTSTPTTDGK